jgi:hypothetical protein
MTPVARGYSRADERPGNRRRSPVSLAAQDQLTGRE